jgi:hypothetical protein
MEDQFHTPRTSSDDINPAIEAIDLVIVTTIDQAVKANYLTMPMRSVNLIPVA